MAKGLGIFFAHSINKYRTFLNDNYKKLFLYYVFY